MLEEILGKVKNEIGGDLLSKFNLSEEKATQAFSLTGDTLKDVIAKASSGNMLDGVMNLFSSNDNDEKGNSLFENIGSTLSGKFSENLGVGNDTANSMKDMILAKIMPLFGNNLGGNFDISSLLSMVGGAKDGDAGLSGIIGKVTSFFK